MVWATGNRGRARLAPGRHRASYVGSVPIPPDLQAPAPDLGMLEREPTPEHRGSSVGGWRPPLSGRSFVDVTEVMEKGPDDVYVEREARLEEGDGRSV